MRLIRLASALGAAMVLTGCISATTLINLKADGSGTIEQTTAMSAQTMAMLSSFGSKSDTEPGAAATPDIFSEKEAREAATKLGTGVRYVSSETIKTADMEGRKTIYAFDDIRTLKVSQKPSAPGGDSSGGMTMGGDAPEDMAFGFTKLPNGHSQVTVRFPEMKFDDKSDDGNAKKSEDAAPPAAVEMMKQMFKGLRIDIAMRVDGKVVKTNSEFVEGPKVTLLSIDFEKLLANDALLKKMQQPKSVEEAKKVLKDVPGMKINLDREITVEFAK